jgi:hypothetical protein
LQTDKPHVPYKMGQVEILLLKHDISASIGIAGPAGSQGAIGARTRVKFMGFVPQLLIMGFKCEV